MSQEDDFAIRRTFDAPRHLVWQAWTEPERLAQWWGPTGFTLSVLQMDLRPGGIFHYGMRAPNGFEMFGKFEYRDITEPDTIVSLLCFADAAGNPVRHPASATWPLHTENRMTLTEQEGKTLLDLRSTPFQANDIERATFRAGHASMVQGFAGTFDQLDAYLATAQGNT